MNSPPRRGLGPGAKGPGLDEVALGEARRQRPRKGREVQKQQSAFLVGVSKGAESPLVQRKARGFERG